MTFAAKIIHDGLLNENEGESIIVENYVIECKLMSSVHHPNIVQFLGLCMLPELKLPALVMELMHTNLHDFLVSEENINIPLTVKRSILRDVADGLHYLHSMTPEAIVHRDLSAKNVLLTSSLEAKISDFGNSRFLPSNYDWSQLTKAPGAAIYMPPEAEGSYDGTKLDIFSFGVLTLFTLTQVSYSVIV